MLKLQKTGIFIFFDAQHRFASGRDLLRKKRYEMLDGVMNDFLFMRGCGVGKNVV